jgi:lysophospholipase L1-like esterase
VRFVALGDSITAGFGDPMPGGAWRGWAALLAESLGADLHNLARSGALTRDVVYRQLPRAMALRPDIAAVVVGVNDTLRNTFDAEAIGGMLDEAVSALRAGGALVLTARLPDPGRMFGLPGALARPLARRIRAVNSVADVVAARYGTLHFDAAEHPSTYDRRMWSVDRLHPSERGHRLLAAAYFDLVAGELGLPAHARPDPEPHNPEPGLAAQAWWMATRGSRWVVDRSTDLVPYLVKMAITEWWNGPAGPVPLADSRVEPIGGCVSTSGTPTGGAAAGAR